MLLNIKINPQTKYDFALCGVKKLFKISIKLNLSFEEFMSSMLGKLL